MLSDLSVHLSIPTGPVPYLTTARHLQEGAASSPHLHHLWAGFLLCHGLSRAALYGPACIPSILYLAYLQLESMDVSSLIIKYLRRTYMTLLVLI